MKNLEIAPCGIDCTQCASYKVTVNQDLKAAALIVEWYRSRGWIGANDGAEAVMEKIPLCRGCQNSTDGCFFKCGCHMLKCCKEKQLEHCGKCTDFPCGHYQEFASGHEAHRKAMDYLSTLKEI